MQGNFDEGVAAQMKAMRIRNGLHGSDSEHKDVALSLNNLAGLYDSQVCCVV